MTTRSPRIVALVPCRDGAGTVGKVVAGLRSDGRISDVVVIDDSSRDESVVEAIAAGARVVQLPENVGKGGALSAGVRAADDADVYLLVDADTADSALQATALLTPVLSDEADLVIGILPSAAGRGGFGVVKRFSAWGIRHACRWKPVAPLSGQRAIRADLLRSLTLAPRFGVEVGMTIDAVRSGARVLEMPVAMTHRHRGRKLEGFLHRAVQGRDIARALWPRLLGRRLRMGIVLGMAVLAIVSCLLIAHKNQAETADVLPQATNVVVNTDCNAASDGQSSGNVGLLIGGSYDDLTHVLRSGSRDAKAPESPYVNVIDSDDSSGVPAVDVCLARDDAGAVRMQNLNVYGTLTSGSTHRRGLVDITDIAPTVLQMEGQRIPATMTGSSARVESGAQSINLAQELAGSFFYKHFVPRVIVVYVLLQVVLFGALWIGWMRNKTIRGAVPISLCVAAFPLATYLTRWIYGWGSPSELAWSATCVTFVGMIVGMSYLAAPTPVRALQRILLATIVFLATDVLLGSHLQLGGVFGSSILLGTRYVGLGNPASAILLFAAILWSALHVRAATDRSAAIMRIVAMFAVLTAIVGLSGLGDDVGGLLSFMVSGFLLVVLLSGKRINIAKAFAGSLSALALLVVAAGVDYARPAESQTHMGRLFGRTLHEGAHPLFTTIGHKIHVNVFGYGFPWNLMVIGFFLVMLVGLCQHRWAKTLPVGSFERTGAMVALTAALLAYAVNDSGVVVVALVSVFLGPFIAVQLRPARLSIPKLEVSAP